ncbi:MAG: hypothetical protein PUH11_05530 [Bacilli bacterium]|nr:hypothetical protein [Bacilli bacterium]
MKKICLAELKKRIKAEKETLKQLTRNDTTNRNTQIFVDKDIASQIEDNNYNYFETNSKLQTSMLYITKMTALLNKMTSTTIITCGDFTGSISEAIILLKYLTQMNDRADNMLFIDVSRKMTFDNKIVKTKYFYDEEAVKKKKAKLTKAVADLQMAIDKAMFATEIDMSEIEIPNELIYKIFGD